MNFKDLVLPDKLIVDKDTLTGTYGKFIAEPFERGYGHTIGNSLRRILLSSLEGAAVTAVRIKGAPHEYSVVPGVKEDVINILLNLKRVRFKMYGQGMEVLTLSTKKEGPVKAGDIRANPQVEILNPELSFATLDSGGELEMELEVSRGRCYVPAEKNKRPGHPLGTIPVDAIFTPVIRVHYEVENTRVGQMTDYDRLILQIWTDGSVTPQDALAYSALILKNSLAVFITIDEQAVEIGEKVEISSPEQKTNPERERLEELINQPVDNIELSVRASNCLKNAKIKTIKELVIKRDEELLAYKNFGRKSLDEIKEQLQELGLSLAMNEKIKELGIPAESEKANAH
ncbi:MAG: DNA-directed RNA polymerase subunit alpha [Elusimicrobiota bacterium]